MLMDVEMASGSSWRGVPLSEIRGSEFPWGAPEFPLVAPSRSHAVLYHIPSSGDFADRPLEPQKGQDKWDSDHVRMPCSSKSLYPVEDENGEVHLKKRWGMIVDALRKPILNSRQLADTILSYNTKFKNNWQFTSLHALFNDHLDEEESGYFFTVTLPEIARLALELPKLIQAPIPLLKQQSNSSISLTQHQVASLLANAFFCTYPRRNTSKRASEYESYPCINFSTLYEAHPHDDVLEKLKCFCHYFRRVCTKRPSTGVVTFSRRSVPARRCPQWARSAELISTLPVHVDSDAMIEDADGLIQMDFANKYLGGGVLGRGSVQEEIRFAICPELVVSMLFTEMMKPNEALLMIGCERYSRHAGYGHALRWAGDFRDSTPRDSASRRRVAVLAVDALPYASSRAEFHPDSVTRELNKAWIGFTFFSDGQSSLQYPGIATGNWGCGAFGGTPQLKSLIQLMACAQARRPMAYFTFGDTALRDEIISIYNLLARFNVTVGKLYQYIEMYSKTECTLRTDLHSFIQQTILHGNQATSPPKAVNNMSIISSPETGQNKNEQKQLNNSPDLFSQDDGLTLNYSDTNSKISTEKTCKLPTITDQLKIANSEYKMAARTSKIIEELHKDDESDNLNINKDSTSKYFEKQGDCKSIDHKMEDRNDKMASGSNLNTNIDKTGRKSLFEEMEKLDEDHGRFSLSTPRLPLNESKIVIPESDPSMDSDYQASPEVKKKITKKITDYFSKKTT